MSEGWHEFMKTAPDEVASVVVTLRFPANPDLPAATHDRPVAIVGAAYVGDAEEGLALTRTRPWSAGSRGTFAERLAVFLGCVIVAFSRL